MARRCDLLDIGPRFGHNVSHSNRKSKKVNEPNFQSKRFWLASENRWVRLRVSTRGIRGKWRWN